MVVLIEKKIMLTSSRHNSCISFNSTYLLVRAQKFVFVMVTNELGGGADGKRGHDVYLFFWSGVEKKIHLEEIVRLLSIT